MASPKDFWVNQESVAPQWKSIRYLAEPNYHRAVLEHQALVDKIENHGVKVTYFEGSTHAGLDAIYCRDASLFTDHGVVLCRMGKSTRDSEPSMQERTFRDQGISVLGAITAPGTLEGGDVAWLDEQTLAVAHGYRTNEVGFRQLQDLLSPLGISLVQVSLPHYKGSGDVFHLMSIFSPIARDLAVVYSPLMPVKFRQLLLAKGFKLIEVSDQEFETMGCNVLALAPRKCVMLAGNPRTKSALESAGCKVIEYEGHNISFLGSGGPTCLTRPAIRN